VPKEQIHYLVLITANAKGVKSDHVRVSEIMSQLSPLQQSNWEYHARRTEETAFQGTRTDQSLNRDDSKLWDEEK